MDGTSRRSFDAVILKELKRKVISDMNLSISGDAMTRL